MDAVDACVFCLCACLFLRVCSIPLIIFSGPGLKTITHTYIYIDRYIYIYIHISVGFRVYGLGFRVRALGCGLWALGCGQWAVGCGLWAVGFGEPGCLFAMLKLGAQGVVWVQKTMATSQFSSTKTPNPKPQTPNPKPQTPNLKPQSPNPEP